VPDDSPTAGRDPAAPAAPVAPPATDPTELANTSTATHRRLRAEVWIVLGLSLGQAAVYAIVRLYARLTADVPLAQQTTTLNPSLSTRPYLDLTYQLLNIGFALVPVGEQVQRIGLDPARPGRDLGVGLLLAAAVGIPGLGVYAAGRFLGVTVEVQAAGLAPYRWAVPVLVLSALQNALLEEVVAVGYLVERLTQLRWGVPGILVASALLRGAYHLYQGPGMALGNVAMGLLFTWYYLRRRRVMPLVIAHTALDVVAFVGYTVLAESVLHALGVT